jgi:hypothetical protein
MKAVEPGFFNIADSHAVLTLSLMAAKEYAIGVIDKQPNANKDNILKAKSVVSKARSTVDLASIICNYALKHQSEGLGVIGTRRKY